MTLTVPREKSQKIPTQSCPACGGVMNRAGDMEGHLPRPGDCTICVHCATALTFTAELTARLPTPEEQREFDTHPDVQRLRARLLALIARDKRGELPQEAIDPDDPPTVQAMIIGGASSDAPWGVMRIPPGFLQ